MLAHEPAAPSVRPAMLVVETTPPRPDSCARAASGHAAAPPTRVRKSRRLIASGSRSNEGTTINDVRGRSATTWQSFQFSRAPGIAWPWDS